MEHALPDTLAIRWPAGDPLPPPATEQALERAAGVLAAGGLVAIPTETVYGLAALALDTAAVARIFKAKGRAATNPLIVHVADATMARGLAAEWPAAAERITAALWPGPVTVVVPKAAVVPLEVTAGGETVALRCPDQRLTRRLIEKLGQPLAAPSANRSLGVSPTTAAHVLESLGARVDLILDGGPCGRGIESTVVDCTQQPAVVLRPGPVTLVRLAEVLGGAVISRELAADVAAEAPARAPGQQRRHYAPATPLEVSAAAAERVAGLAEEGKQVGWLTLSPDAPQTRRIAAAFQMIVVPMPAEPAAYAALLYAVLHAIDKRGLDRIVVEAPPTSAAWVAVHDRLSRAATPAETANDD
jgi:L-threonylcarbamoyladenylate synthase